jgi:hypothetical protein
MSFVARLSFAGCVFAAGIAVAKPPVPANACVPLPPKQVVETFISADCEQCWQQAAPDEKPAERTMHIDWIVPGRKGDEAPLAVAAVNEASARLKLQLTPEAGTVQKQALPAPPAGVKLTVQSGLAWNGYIGLSFELERNPSSLPADAMGWVALVERVPAGEDGTPVERQLVRTVVGPLMLQPSAGQRRLQHLRAVLLPPNSHADRLAAVGWIERADGKMLLAAESPAAGCVEQ